jgi:hypothetical protein
VVFAEDVWSAAGITRTLRPEGGRHRLAYNV